MKREFEFDQRVERSILTTYRKELWKPFILAVKRYELIQEGDKIAVCISGGKDSMLMAKLMQELQRHSKVHFETVFLVMDPGYNEINRRKIEQNAALLNVPITIFESNIFDSVYHIEKSPCYLCARMRRGHLYNFARELGCNKIAYAHHKDDVIETMLLSLLYEGRFYSFPPKTYLDQMDLTVIRPLFFVDEADVIGFWHKYQLPVAKSPCPADGHTRREYSKQLLRQLNLENPGVKNRMFTAILNAELSDWPDRIIPDRH